MGHARLGEVVTWLLAIPRSRAINALQRGERFRHRELPDDETEATAESAPAAQDLLDAMRGETPRAPASATLDARSRPWWRWPSSAAGDYQLAPAGTAHAVFGTDTGGMIFAHGDLDWTCTAADALAAAGPRAPPLQCRP